MRDYLMIVRVIRDLKLKTDKYHGFFIGYKLMKLKKISVCFKLGI